VVYLCKQVIAQDRTGNLHFFVNSVKFISEVIEKASLTPEVAKVVCADNYENNIKLASVDRVQNDLTLKGFPISTPSDPVKKINFYTSTAFEGCDIYDPLGRTYIVSDAGRAQTMMDISTLFIQICGRLRDSIYKQEIVHIYSVTRYSENLTLEEHTQATKETLGKALSLAEDVNRMSEESRKVVLGKIPYLNEEYVSIEDNRLIVDKNLANIDIVNFKITKQIYKTVITLTEELKRNGFGVSVRSITVDSPAEKVEMNPNAKVSFQELFDEYAEIKERPLTFSLNTPHFKLAVIEAKNPLIKEAYQKLG